MLPIAPLSTKLIVEVLEKLLAKQVSRKEVLEWQQLLTKKYGYSLQGGNGFPIGHNEGLWHFISLAALLTENKLSDEPDEDFLITDHDLREYLFELNKVDMPVSSAQVQFFRYHQGELFVRTGKPVRYLITLQDPTLFTRNDLRGCRGQWDDLNDLTESLGVLYDGCGYSISQSLGHYPGLVTFEGEVGNKENLASLLSLWHVEPEQIEWINEAFDSEKCTLTRLDDNSNTIVMNTFDSYIKAELTRIQFERRKHKQVYEVIRS